MAIGSGIQVILRLLPQQIVRLPVLALLMGGIYEVHCRDGLRCHDIYTNFYDCLFRESSNIKVITSIILEATVLVRLMGGIYEV
jgi:hypothetical protein